jgi:hypothetical protein
MRTSAFSDEKRGRLGAPSLNDGMTNDLIALWTTVPPNVSGSAVQRWAVVRTAQ